MTGSLPKSYDRDSRCACHMNCPERDTENCWAFRHKVQDLIENGTIVVSARVAQNSGTNHLPAHGAGPSNLAVNMLSIGECPMDPSQLIGPLSTAVQVHLTRNRVPLVAPVDYSPSYPYMIDGPALPGPRPLTQNMTRLTLTSAPQAATRPILIIGEVKLNRFWRLDQRSSART